MSNQDKPVTLVYTNYRGETSERTITPIKPWFGSTEWHPEPQWLLTAFDHEKQANRDFALKDFGYPSPSPRAQALEEAARQCDICADLSQDQLDKEQDRNVRASLRGEIVASKVNAARIRALSSQPVADGWLPIETAPDNQQGPFLVTNNPKALNAFGRPSHVWCVSGIYKDNDGSFCAFEGNQKIHGLLMFMPVCAPLPASPEVSG